MTNIAETIVCKLVAKAKLRGWDPIDIIVQLFHVEDAPHSGRPKCSNVVVQHILNTMLKNSTIRGYSYQKLASIVSAIPGIASVSTSTIYRVLISKGYGSYKMTVKPGLNEDNKKYTSTSAKNMNTRLLRIGKM